MAIDDRRLFYFEDYAPGLETKGGRYRVRAEEIVEFGERFDPQPFHTNPIAAADSHFAGLVAPGCLTFSIRSALVNQLDFRPALIAGLGVEMLELPHPVRPGDELTLRMRVLSRRRSESKPDRGVVELEYAIENQHREVVLSMSAKMLVALREPAPDRSLEP
jgi:acyl dehydratase